MLVSALVCALPPLIALDTLDSLLSSLLSGIMLAAVLSRLLLINFNQPIVLTILVLALVTILGHPLARSLVEDQFAIALLILDALLGGKLLPLGLGLLLGHALLARQVGGRGGQAEGDAGAVVGFCDGAGGEELVDKSLSAIASGVLDVGFLDLGHGREGVGVVAEKVAQVEGVGNGLVDSDGEARLGACGDFGVDLHFVDAHSGVVRSCVAVMVLSVMVQHNFCSETFFADNYPQEAAIRSQLILSVRSPTLAAAVGAWTKSGAINK